MGVPDREPDIKLVGLSVWVHGYEYPADVDNPWDANWLSITAECVGQNSLAWLAGSYLRTDELAAWLAACRNLLTAKSHRAELSPMEPMLGVSISRASDNSQLEAAIMLATELTTERHEWRFEIDQSYVNRLMEQIETVLRDYPVRAR